MRPDIAKQSDLHNDLDFKYHITHFSLHVPPVQAKPWLLSVVALSQICKSSPSCDTRSHPRATFKNFSQQRANISCSLCSTLDFSILLSPIESLQQLFHSLLLEDSTSSDSSAWLSLWNLFGLIYYFQYILLLSKSNSTAKGPETQNRYTFTRQVDKAYPKAKRIATKFLCLKGKWHQSIITYSQLVHIV